MSSGTVLKPQRLQRTEGGGLANVGRGKRKRPAGEERTKGETQERRKERRDLGGPRASGRERA